MVEPIESAEIFGNATAVQEPAPKHTVEGHDRCAYYWSDRDENDPVGGMYCPHGNPAEGAFYSEDHLNDLRRAAHRVIGLIDMRMPKGVWKNNHVEKLRELAK